MKNGSNRAVLTADLLSGDGPFAAVADDFLVDRCSYCLTAGSDEIRFYDSGYLCGECRGLPGHAG